MWWSRALVVLLLVALGPVGCGFRPLYGRADSAPSPVAEELASVRVLGIENRSGQQLRNDLVRLLSPKGEPGRPRYLLKVTLTESLQGLALSDDGNATVGRVMLQAAYTLTEAESEKTVFQATARSFASYRHLGPRYASVVSERDNEALAIADLAATIQSRVASWLATSRESDGESQ